MITILLEMMVMMLVSLAAIKGLASMKYGNTMKLADRIGINLYENNKVAAYIWLATAELLVLRGWVESMFFYKYEGTYITSGITVIVLWIWAFFVSIAIPKLAGFKGWGSLVVSSILMTITSVTVLTLM